MVFKSIFKKKEEEGEEEEEFVEITGEEKERKKMNIRVETLEDFRDVERVQGLLREGNIIFLRIRKLRERDMGELKRSVEKLRRTSIAMNGDIIGVDEDYLILTPPYAKIFRGEEAK